MNEQEFWSIVESARRSAAGDTEARVEALEAGLAALDCSSIQGFQHQYDQIIHRANRWDLWGAAYLMNGGCSDDGFRYFCHWLISEGEDTFARAIAEPDTLADLTRQEYFELEAFAYVAVKQFEAKCGSELERDFSIELAPPAGEEWSEEDLPALFPKLAAKYGEV